MPELPTDRQLKQKWSLHDRLGASFRSWLPSLTLQRTRAAADDFIDDPVAVRLDEHGVVSDVVDHLRSRIEQDAYLAVIENGCGFNRRQPIDNQIVKDQEHRH